VKHDRRHRIQKLASHLSRERAQAKPETVVTLSMMSGSSMLAFSRLSEDAAVSAVTRLVRLFF
jgi:hypothetical protein